MKGQAAVEYLMTYGWAILALLIVLAALLSSGVLTPNYLVSEECSFGTSLKCSAAAFDSGGVTKMDMNVYNGFPYKVRIQDIEIMSEDGSQSFTGFDSGVELESGANYTFRATLGGPAANPNTLKRFVGNITYDSCAPELGGCSSNDHVLSGRVTAKIIPQ